MSSTKVSQPQSLDAASPRNSAFDPLPSPSAVLQDTDASVVYKNIRAAIFQSGIKTNNGDPSTGSDTPSNQMASLSVADFDITSRNSNQRNTVGVESTFILSEEDSSIADLENWEDLNDYLDELCSYGVDRLTREPDVLMGECVRLQKQLEDVACGNYRALIQSFECAGAVREGVLELQVQLQELIQTKLPDLTESLAMESTQKILEQEQLRREKVRMMAEYPRISELLELPKLMLALIKGQCYSETFEVETYIQKLCTFFPENDLFVSLSNDAKLILLQMVHQLLSVLRTTIQLPTCLRIIGYLRRVSSSNEVLLRRLFLQCRGQWMSSNLTAGSVTTAQGKLVRLSDETRAMLFEIITQYRAVFSDDPDDLVEIHTNMHDCDKRSILPDWTNIIISEFCTQLEEGLKEIQDGASLATVMQQAMYCGQSLGRVGCDFRPQLVPLFEEAQLRIFRASTGASLSRFEVMIESHKWSENISLLNHSTTHYTNSENEQGFRTQDFMTPPTDLLNHPPLAVLLNGLLVAFNEIRSCCLHSTIQSIQDNTASVLLKSIKSMETVGGPGGIYLKKSEKVYFQQMAVAFRDIFIPHAVKCVNRIMGNDVRFEPTEVYITAKALVGDEL